jgi:sterol-4alpha-carboxylate 3-dehydrogenase (decarboxylating)
MQIAVWVGIFVNVVFYTAFAGLSIGNMIKCTGLAQVNDPYCLFNEGINVLLNSMVNVITDFYVLLLPIPRLIKLQLKQNQMLGLLLVFASGLG